MQLKKFWKEFLLVFILTFVLQFLADYSDNFVSDEIIRENLFSPIVYLIAFIVLMLPLFAAIIGGYLISKKSLKKTDSMLVPGIAAALAGIFLLLIPLTQFYSLNDAGWQEEFSKAKTETQKLGLNFFEEMNLEDFKNLTINSTLIALPFIGLLNLAFGIVGGLIGNYLYSRKKG